MTALGWLLLLTWIWPLLLAALGPRPRLWWLPAVGAGPALATALLVPVGTTLELPWLFLGTTLAMNPLTQIYLTFTSLLWLVAGVYAAFAHRGGEHAGRFNLLFLLAMAGNLWLIVGQDLFSFYVGFAIMGLSSYGLVIHDGQPAALRAGKVYLVMALFGEVCLFASLVLIASQTGTTVPNADDLVKLDGLAIALLLLGLGVKAGMVPLHVWLPLAHPAAPIAASAVLSGTMIKTALLGWMRFLPVGAVALPEWGGLLLAAGTLTLLFALPIGLTQSDPKVVLAYSSISKMGLMMLVLGLALIEPALAPLAVAGIAFYAANHALVKGGLFLGVGMRKHAATHPPVVQAAVLGALVFLALSLAGAPFTSGAVAKYELKPLFGALDWAWIGAVVGISTFGTTLLMVRFVWVSYRTEPHPEPGYRWPGVGWGVLIGLVLLLPFVFGKPAAWVTNLVNVPSALLLGVLVVVFGLRRPGLFAPLIGRIPPGDILGLFTRLQQQLFGALQRIDQRWQVHRNAFNQRAVDAFERVFAGPTGDSERSLREWPVAGGIWVGLSTLLLLFVLAGLPPVADTVPAPPAPDTEQKRELALPVAATPEVTAALRDGETETDAGLIEPETDPMSEPIEPTEPNDPSAPDLETDATAPVAVSTPTTTSATPEIPEPPVFVEPEPVPASAVETAPEVEPAAAPEPQTDSEPVSPCNPPVDYLFAPVTQTGTPLALTRCDANGDPLRNPSSSRELVRRVQQWLDQSGYDPGPIDGLMGPRTRSAVRQLQGDNALTADGDISFELLDLLQSGPSEND